MVENKRKIYGVEITVIEQTTVYVKAESEEAAVEWVNVDPDWFDRDAVESKTEVIGTFDDWCEVGGHRVYDSEAED